MNIQKITKILTDAGIEENEAKIEVRMLFEHFCNYTEKDFIDYLNEWLFPEQQSKLVRQLDFYDYEIPEEYQKYPRFNF